MAGSSTYPELIDNKTAIVDGTDYMEGDNVNHAYVPINTTQTFIGAAGKAQSWSTDLLDFLCHGTAPICVKKDANTITVKAGAVAVKHHDDSFRMLRRNTSDVDVVAANLDTGSMADATYYYIYAVADSAATTFTVVFSASATTPTGATNYELIGWFYNQAAGSLTITDGLVGNVKTNGRNTPNVVWKSSATTVTTTSGTLVDDTEATIKFYSSGRPVKITYNIGGDIGSDVVEYCGISVDGSDVAASLRAGRVSVASLPTGVSTVTMQSLTAGEHTIQGRIKRSNGTLSVYSRIIIAEEL